MVIDTSAVLAVFFEEPTAVWVAAELQRHSGELCMSTVNVVEVLILIHDRHSARAADMEHRLMTGGIRFVSPDMRQAKIAAEARLKFPLNLGDCFAYALSVVEDCPIIALDEDFRKTDRPVVAPPRR